MLILVSGSTRTVRQLASRRPKLGHLLAPGNRNSVGSVLATGLPWAVDNGAYSGFDPERFRRLLARVAGQPRCLFVVCPDVVADWRATLARFGEWQGEVARTGQPVALVGQDGCQERDIPWPDFDAWFVGGTTAWKLSEESRLICAEAKRRGKHVHMGRVNSMRRLRIACEWGCDSVDGSSYSRWHHRTITHRPDMSLERHLRFLASVEREKAEQLLLFGD